MTNLSKYLTASAPALALGLVLVSLASPSFAQRGDHAMSGAREQALRECSTGADKYTNSTWQTTQLHSFRSCMMQHGEQE
jgi:hypothetical protein